MSEARPAPPSPLLARPDLLPLGALLFLGAAVRTAYLLVTRIPPYDPWRHLLLVDNIREGVGFTLFEGQPYLWYSPVWYYLCALLPRSMGMEWLAGLLSLLAVPATYVLLRGNGDAAARRVALAGGLLMALSGPLVAFTCHYGPEAFSLALTLGALVLCLRGRGPLTAFVAGLAFGLALTARLNFALNFFLFLPLLRGPRRAVALIGGSAVPLLLAWWRNHRIIEAYPWVFTWDGLATRSADFDPLSTLVVQMHPAVREGLHRLHEIVVPWPEWIRGPRGIAWDGILFVLCGVLCLLAARRVSLLLAGGTTLAYFLLLDGSNSSHFFRVYLPVFPAFFLAAAVTAGRLWRSDRSAAPFLGWLPVLLLLLGGAGQLRPPADLTLQLVNPPEGLLREPAYMVNSGFFHPESLIYGHPDKRFIGMPLDPGQFHAFRRSFPEYRHVLWHDFSVQDDLAAALRQDRDFPLLRSGANLYGRRYVVLGPASESAAP